MVLHRPVETAPFCGKYGGYFRFARFTNKATIGFAECIGEWVLKNSLCKNLQKIDRVRTPYKGFVEVA